MTNVTSLLDSWADIVSNLPVAGGVLYPETTNGNGFYTASYGDNYFVEQLGLSPNFEPTINSSVMPQLIHQHDIENAVSSLVASIFWIAGYAYPISGPNPQKAPLILQSGSTMVKTPIFVARLNISLLAASIGLGASVGLLWLLIIFSAGAANAGKSGLTSLGFLQTMWIFHHHPELSAILEDAEEPTKKNLRTAGMVKVRLADALESKVIA
ncbi:hypothetical protein B0H16DRAFT_1711546 [Mycena metata]|uniref:Uncharacterized protein n=1 Tax=Mycena metata TaxID=1033252 RepID=A0AAD7K6J5_9AGAR|nr:hypothetical protein B0H16DRAFT_1711546 [Mycena metata]